MELHYELQGPEKLCLYVRGWQAITNGENGTRAFKEQLGVQDVPSVSQHFSSYTIVFHVCLSTGNGPFSGTGPMQEVSLMRKSEFLSEIHVLWQKL